jgi:hypothetical protein
MSDLLSVLEGGPYHRFSDWSISAVPKVAAGVYTISDQDSFIYVGISRRAMTSEDVGAPDEPTKARDCGHA